ncbi:MAG: hypothetical protein NTY74_04080 [Ignavibacteriae bacterium]|nr:hypothetical protein [Ignavibacteriota bacterium]
MKKLFTLALFISLLLFIGCKLFSLFGFKSNYEKGVELINEKKYELALKEFNKLDSTNNNYSNAKSKIFYINGVLNYNDNNFIDAFNNFSKVYKEDEFYKDSKSLIDSIEHKSIFCYEYGMELLKTKDYKNALKYFKQINDSDEYSEKVQYKKRYIYGIFAYDEKDYSKAWEKLVFIDKRDEIYPEAQELLLKVNKILIPDKIKTECIYIINSSADFNNIFQEWGRFEINKSNINDNRYIDMLEKSRKEFLKELIDYEEYEPATRKFINSVNVWMNYIIDWVNFTKKYWKGYFSVGMFPTDEWNQNLSKFRAKRKSLELDVWIIQNKLRNKYHFSTSNSPF